MSEPIAHVFVARVRERMDELGMSQSALAEKMGVGRSFVSQMLNGYRRPGLESLESFAVALEMEPAELIREKKSRRSY